MGSEMCIRDSLKPTATTWSERGEGEHVREGRRRAVAASSLLRDAWLGGAAPEAQTPLPWLRGAAFEMHPPIAEFMPRLRGTALLARVPVAELGPWPMGIAHDARVPVVEIWTRMEGNRVGDAGSLRRYCMKICDSGLRCP